MKADDLRKILKAGPFKPVRIGLSDGRSVLIRHPDQVVVSDRTLFVGLAKLESSKPLATPSSGEVLAHDWLWVNLVQVTTVEPVNGTRPRPRRKQRGGR